MSDATRWEWPGGKLDATDPTVWDGALREWEEETGATLPDDAEHAGSFLSADGVYQAYVIRIPHEADLTFDLQPEEVSDVAWWDPTDLEGNDLVRDKVQENLPLLRRFLIGGEASKSAISAARFHRHTDRIVAHYAPLVTQALRAMIPAGTIQHAIQAAQGESPDAYKPTSDPFAAQKRAPIPKDLAQRAISILNNGLSTAGKLKAVLGDLWGDAGLQGANGAAEASQGVMLSSLQSVVSDLPDDYWDNWTPGWGEAAARAADGGLADLLGQADVTIRGITGSLLDRLGNTIAQGVQNGDGAEAIGRACRDVIADPSRAFTVADTECARAMSATALSTYQQNDVQMLDWLAEGDACPDCQDNADASPVAIDDGFPNGQMPPQHPRCRCSLAAHIDTGGDGE